MTMSEVVISSSTTDPRVSSPQSDSAMGGSDSTSQKNDSSFSDDKEEILESFGENEDVEYEP